jgi:hypothetical protein
MATQQDEVELESGIWNLEHWNLEFGTLESRIWNTGIWNWDLESGTGIWSWDLESGAGIWNLDLGSGTGIWNWDLGSGIGNLAWPMHGSVSCRKTDGPPGVSSASWNAARICLIDLTIFVPEAANNILPLDYLGSTRLTDK